MIRLSRFLLGGLLTIGSFAVVPAQAQTVVLNHPTWGPAAPATAQYYYLPEIDGYYDLRDQHYVVQRNGQWQRVSQLNGYDRSTWRPRVVDYIGDQPWSRHDEYRRRYPANLPPGQRKRLESGKGLPPGQAKKYYGNRDDQRYTDEQRRRYEDRNRDRRDYDDDRDDRGSKDKGYKKKVYKGKGKDKD